MKKVIAIAFAISSVSVGLAACGSSSTPADTTVAVVDTTMPASDTTVAGTDTTMVTDTTVAG
ncbi:MAG: hypothetical protein ACH36C_09655 [Ilumatobacteraceae bacterium]|jgi:ABC-type glycerol-3-phosphate transport system substrate-binding protein